MVSLLFKKASAKAGAAPGTLMHIGEQRMAQVRLSAIVYDESSIEERSPGTLENAAQALWRSSWRCVTARAPRGSM